MVSGIGELVDVTAITSIPKVFKSVERFLYGATQTAKADLIENLKSIIEEAINTVSYKENVSISVEGIEYLRDEISKLGLKYAENKNQEEILNAIKHSFDIKKYTTADNVDLIIFMNNLFLEIDTGIKHCKAINDIYTAENVSKILEKVENVQEANKLLKNLTRKVDELFLEMQKNTNYNFSNDFKSKNNKETEKNNTHESMFFKEVYESIIYDSYEILNKKFTDADSEHISLKRQTLYEIYLNSIRSLNSTMLIGEENEINRHKHAACFTVAIIKAKTFDIKLLSSNNNKKFLVLQKFLNELLGFYVGLMVVKMYSSYSYYDYTKDLDGAKKLFKSEIIFPKHAEGMHSFLYIMLMALSKINDESEISSILFLSAIYSYYENFMVCNLNGVIESEKR